VCSEGPRILEEGIAYRASDIDIVWLNGYGFPAVKGGPMHIANVVGLQHVKARLDQYAAQRGNTQGYWTAAKLLCDLAARGRQFGNASAQSEASSLAG
jgi:3-hydroxyacyl-CoA dehydrogenase